MQPKILLFDIETAPNVSYTWGKYEQTAIDFVEEWYMLCFAYKWLNKPVQVRSLQDYPTYRKQPHNDKYLVTELWELFNQADIIIAHNGDAFDIKKANAAFLRHGLGVPSHYRTIDTLKIARKQFKLNSNKLDDICRHIGIGEKLSTGGFELWKGCMDGDEKAWRKMCQYNKQDVVLLEKLYLKLLPWIYNHPNLNIIFENNGCTNCGSTDQVSHGFRYAQGTKYRRLQCSTCGTWNRQTLKGKTSNM